MQLRRDAAGERATKPICSGDADKVDKLSILIPAMPLLSALSITLLTDRPHRRVARLSVGFSALTLLLAAAALVLYLYQPQPQWLSSGLGWGSLYLDPLSLLMSLIVAGISLVVHVYSVRYMAEEPGYARFFIMLDVMAAAILLMVAAGDLITLLVAWHLIGVALYFLLGHDTARPAAQRYAFWSFFTYRLGDLPLILAAILLYQAYGTVSLPALFEQITAAPAAHTVLGVPLPTMVALLVALAAFARSAQFPLHTWLPDAMAGPTPGSALIHAATMVAAGVYLVGRAFMIYGNAPQWVLIVVAFIGAFTSLFAASIATLRHDIKEVLAYSTISQLGYMIMAIGLGGWAAGNFHLMTHAFFKALLFLAAGSVIHAHHHNQLLHKMGGLRKKIPITFWTWIIGYLALAGFPGFSGFFSKDELLLAAWTWEPTALHGLGLIAKLPFIMALATAFLTAYYMTRATWLAFFGEPRDQHLYDHAHESPWTMTTPLVILAIPAALSGWLWAALPAHWFGLESLVVLEKFLHLPGIEMETSYGTAATVTAMATTAGLVGIFVGYLLYAKVKPATRARWIESFKPVYNLVRNKYYVDEFYEWTAINGTLAASRAIAWFDGAVVDGLVNLVGTFGNGFAAVSGWIDANIIDTLVTMWSDIARAFASAFRRLSTGYVQQYMLTFVVVIVASVLLFQVIR